MLDSLVIFLITLVSFSHSFSFQGWDVSISADEFEEVLYDLEKWVAMEMTWQNGIMSYNEVFVLSNAEGLHESFHYLLMLLLKIAFALMALYLALILLASRIAISCNFDDTNTTLNNHYPQNSRMFYIPPTISHELGKVINESFVVPTNDFSVYFPVFQFC